MAVSARGLPSPRGDLSLSAAHADGQSSSFLPNGAVASVSSDVDVLSDRGSRPPHAEIRARARARFQRRELHTNRRRPAAIEVSARFPGQMNGTAVYLRFVPPRFPPLLSLFPPPPPPTSPASVDRELAVRPRVCVAWSIANADLHKQIYADARRRIGGPGQIKSAILRRSPMPADASFEESNAGIVKLRAGLGSPWGIPHGDDRGTDSFP